MDTSQKKEQQGPTYKAIETLNELDKKAALKFIDTVYGKSDLNKIQRLIDGKGTHDLLKGVIIARKLLSREEDPPIQSFISLGLVQPFINLLKEQRPPYIQFEALWTLTNVCTGSELQISFLINNGIIDIALNFIKSIHLEIQDQAAWLLGNIAGETSYFRDLVIESGFINKILEVFNQIKSANRAVSSSILWCIGNLCRGKPEPNFSVVKPFMEVFVYVLKMEFVEKDALVEAIWGINYLSDGGENSIKDIIEADILSKLISWLSSEITDLLIPSLHIIRNIVFSSQQNANIITENQECLDKIISFLFSGKKAARKDAVQIIYRFIQNKSIPIDKLFEDEETIKRIMIIAKVDSLDIGRECFQILAKVTSEANDDQTIQMVDGGLFDIYKKGIALEDVSTILITLEGIYNVLQKGKEMQQNEENPKENNFKSVLENGGCFDKLMQLQNHTNSDIYELCFKILKSQFGS